MRKIIFVSDSKNGLGVVFTGNGFAYLRVVAGEHGEKKGRSKKYKVSSRTIEEIIKLLVLDEMMEEAKQKKPGKGPLFGLTGRMRSGSFLFEDGFKHKSDARRNRLENVFRIMDEDEKREPTEIDAFIDETEDDIPW